MSTFHPMLAWAARLLAGVIALTSAALADGNFVTEIEDLPLMPGLTQPPESGVVFDKAAGRIVEAYAVGDIAAGEVRQFYDQTLPQLGWQTTSTSGVFSREGEILRVEVIDQGAAVTVLYLLVPD